MDYKIVLINTKRSITYNVIRLCLVPKIKEYTQKYTLIFKLKTDE